MSVGLAPTGISPVGALPTAGGGGINAAIAATESPDSASIQATAGPVAATIAATDSSDSAVAIGIGTFGVTQWLRPDSVVSSGAWSPIGGASLDATVSEETASDAEYDEATEPSACEVGLRAGTDPGTTSGFILHYRARGSKANMKASLYQSTNLIEEWTETGLTGSFADYQHTLTNAAAISYSAGNVVYPKLSVKLAALTTLPTWLSGKAVNEWVSISGSAMTDMDNTILSNAGLLAGSPPYGDWRKGFMVNSGGCLKGDDTLLIFGGGGAGAWAGNEVRKLKLTDNAPVWSILVPPMPTSYLGGPYVDAVWHNNNNPPQDSAHAYNKGNKPNARHSYWQAHFINLDNELWVFGCRNDWETDSIDSPVVDRYSFANGDWDAPGTNTDLPYARYWDGPLYCKHPVDEDVYLLLQEHVVRWSRSDRSYTTIATPTDFAFGKAFGAINPDASTNGVILRVGGAIGGHRCFTVDCASGSISSGSDLVGTDAADFDDTFSGNYYACVGCEWDSGLGKFICYFMNGNLYTLEPSGADWLVTKITPTGTPPQTFSAPFDSGNGVYGRFRYVPALKGVVIFGMSSSPWTQNTFFVRTS